MSVVLEDEAEVPADSAFESAVYRSIGDVNSGQLNNLVSQADGGTLFHRYEWLATVEDALGHEPRHVMLIKGGNPVGFLPNFAREVPIPTDIGEQIAGVLPFEIVTPPPPGYGGPIMTGNTERNLTHLFDLNNLTDGYGTVFHAVHTFDLETVQYARYLEALGYRPRLTDCGFFLDLRDDWETVLANMDSGRRRAIRRATEQEYEVTRHPLGEELDRTYDSYVANMERVEGDVLPRSFFENVAERLPDRVRVFKAVVDGSEVGRYVHLLDEESSILHHWLSAIEDESDFEAAPSELLHRAAIRWGIDEGYDQYCFGPTNPHFSDSVFKFKAKYGATPLPSLRWERGTLPVVWNVYDRGRSWYRRSQIEL